MNKASIIETTSQLINLSETELLTKLEIKPTHIENNLQYEKIKNVTCYHNPDVHQGHFYVKNGEIQMIYISNEKVLKSLSFNDLQQQYGPAEQDLRSRVAKYVQQYVYPEIGLAYTADDEKIYFIEIFPKTTMENYLATIYETPPIFRK
ncbi:MAG: hypothetical protein ACPG5B_11065 [Chitinophagales bacterium]